MNLTRNSCNLENNNMEYPIHWASEIEDIEELFKVYAERNTNMDAMLGFRKMFNKEAMIAAFENGKTSFTFEHNFMLAESDIRWIESRVALMRNPATREIEGFLYACKKRCHVNVSSLFCLLSFLFTLFLKKMKPR